MGAIEEIVDFFSQWYPLETVDEYKRGLLYRKGRVIPVRVRPSPEEEENYSDYERDVAEETGKRIWIARWNPLFRPEYPDGYRSSFLFGQPRAEERYKKSKVLMPGMYMRMPVIDDIVTDSVVEQVADLENISAPTADSVDDTVWRDLYSRVLSGELDPTKGLELARTLLHPSNPALHARRNLPRLISCHLYYEVMDLYRAHTAVEAYEDAIAVHTLTVLARAARYLGMTSADWRNADKVNELEEVVLRGRKPEKEEGEGESDDGGDGFDDGRRDGKFTGIRAVATKKWGLRINDFAITDSPPHDVHRHIHEGSGLAMGYDESDEEY